MLKKLVLTICIFVCITAWYYPPLFKPFPAPTGQYAVGTTVMEFIDGSRKEIYSDDSDQHRSLVVRFFYPADLAKRDPLQHKKYNYLGAKMPYFQHHIASEYNIPLWLSTFLLRNIDTHTVINAPVSLDQNTYPVVLFSHGLFGFPSDGYLVLLENIASHGYIVGAIDHPYFNGLTLYANGRAVTEKKLSKQFDQMTQQKQKEFQTQAVATYKADMKFVIDELIKINQNPNNLFYHRLNLDRIGVMGHSAGGTASIEFCRNDTRCKTAVDLDGWYNQAIGDEPLNKPLLLLFGSKSVEVGEPTSEYLERKGLTRQQYFEREANIAEHKKRLCADPTCSYVVVDDVSHSDFTDTMFLKWPFRSWSAVNPYKALAAINTHIVQFLQRFL